METEAARQATLANFMPTSGATHGVVARPYAGRLYVLLHNDEGNAMTRADDWAVSNVQRRAGDASRSEMLEQVIKD